MSDRPPTGPGGFRPQQGGYQPPQGGYPPSQGGYQPSQGGYQPSQGGYQPSQGGYQPSQGGYQPPQGGYPPPHQGGYQQPQGNYPPPPKAGGYPPPPSPQGGYAPPPPTPASKDGYTPWFTRVLAYLIDAVPAAILGVIAMVVIFATATDPTSAYTSDDYGSSYEYNAGISAIGVIVYALAGLLTLAYALWNFGYKQGTTGSSIGKGVMKFKVISEKTGAPIGFGMSIVRQLAHVVDSLACYVGWFFPLWDAKRQTLADKIMSTVCVPISGQR